MEQVLFSETQRFRSWWIWVVILLGIAFPVVILLVTNVGESEHQIIPVVLSFLLPLFIVALLLSMKLETTITPEGISYRFAPIHRRFRTIPFSELESAQVRKYHFIEYGGYGIRYTFGDGKAYNVAGNMGIQLVFKTGKKLLIGTQKADEAAVVLEKIQARNKD